MQHCGMVDAIARRSPNHPPPLTQRRVHCPVLNYGRCHCKELFPPFQGERSWQHKIDWHVYSFQLSLQSTKITLCSPHQFSSWRNPSAYWRSPPAPIALIVKVSPGRACNDYNLTFLCCWEMTNISSIFYISKTFSWHWQKTPNLFENTLMW